MVRGLAFFLLTFYVLPVQTYAQTNKAQQAAKGDKPPSPVASVIPEHKGGPPLQPKADDHINADVRVISTPAKDGYDRAAFWINFALALIGAGGIAVGVCTVLFIQAQAIERVA
jgi:hypothetical protein